MSASYPELNRLLSEILNTIQGAKIINVYHMEDDSIILKIRSERFAGELRIVPGRFLYLVEGSYEKPRELTQRGKTLRTLLSNSTIKTVELLDGERIAVFRLEKEAKELKLICEFLPRGTIIVSDGNDVIIEALHHLKMRDRKIIPGERYTPPPRKWNILTGPTIEFLEKMSLGKSIVSALAVDMGLGGRYAEEVLHLAGVNPSKKVKDLSREEIEKIHEMLQKMLDMAKCGTPVIAFSPEGEVQALPYPMESLGSRGWKFKEASSLNEAFRASYEYELAKKLDEEKRKAVEEKINELEKKLRERRFKAQELLRESETLRKVAEKLFQLSPRIEEMVGKPGRYGVDDLLIEIDEKTREMRMEVEGKELKFAPTESFMKQLSRLFDDAKKAASAAEKLLNEAEEAEKEIEKLKRSIQETLDHAAVKVSARIKAGGGKWYERYRWFITSEGFMAVGGKDASSNISLLKKHLEPSDLIFHAEVKGASVVVLKDGKAAGEKSRNEAAQFAAVYSRAWKEGLSQMTVYYIEPHQVSFTPPPGHYLPRGGFIIKGERKYLTVKLELAIGISEDLRVVYGPPDAVSKMVKDFVKLVPGNKRTEDLAEKIAMLLCRERRVDAKTLRDLKLEIAGLIPYGKGDMPGK